MSTVDKKIDEFKGKLAISYNCGFEAFYRKSLRKPELDKKLPAIFKRGKEGYRYNKKLIASWFKGYDSAIKEDYIKNNRANETEKPFWQLEKEEVEEISNGTIGSAI